MSVLVEDITKKEEQSKLKNKTYFIKIPFLIRRNTGNKLELKLDKYIKWCLKKNYTFKTMEDYLSKTL